ncbi:MAG: hypothetical protein ACYTG0_21030 [Planctomycetota bacterium]|jgi:hypothetical protein
MSHFKHAWIPSFLCRRAATIAAAAVVVTAAARLVAPEAEASEAAKTFRAGACAVDVTPQRLPVIVNGGMREGKATKVVDPLKAKCLVLDDGTTEIVIAVVDNCMVPRAILDEAKELAHKATGIPTARMMISSTHAHSAPAVAGCLGSSVQEDYAAWLPGRIAEAIELARKNLAPARVGWAVGKDPKNVFCRRYLMKPGTARTCLFTGKTGDQAQMNPGYENANSVARTGPADTDVSVLSVQSPDGRPIALLGNYSTHYAGAPALSADYFAVFAEKIGELIGAGEVDPPFVGMMCNGTSGDANCCDFNHPRRQFDRFSVGQDTAQAAFEAHKTIKYYDWVPLAMEERLLKLDVRMPGEEEVAEAKAYLKEHNVVKPQNVTEVYARETVLLSELPPTRELKLQAIRIGELGITAIPNEVYGVTGLAIKKGSPLKPTFNVSLANGGEGYIPPPDQHKLGGYTTWRARSSCLEVEAEPKIRAVLMELLDRVALARPDESLIPSR